MWPKRYLIHDSAIESITERVESDGDYEEAFNSIEKNLIREYSPDLIRSNMDVRFPEDGGLHDQFTQTRWCTTLQIGLL
jgi:hypothetical protein